jgi:hypothetical protein
LVIALPFLSPPGALGLVVEPGAMAEEEVDDWSGVADGAAVVELLESAPGAPDGTGAGAAAVLEGVVVDEEESVPDGLLIALELAALGSVAVSALWQAVRAMAANTGTSRVVYFMMYFLSVIGDVAMRRRVFVAIATAAAARASGLKSSW